MNFRERQCRLLINYLLRMVNHGANSSSLSNPLPCLVRGSLGVRWPLVLVDTSGE